MHEVMPSSADVPGRVLRVRRVLPPGEACPGAMSTLLLAAVVADVDCSCTRSCGGERGAVRALFASKASGERRLPGLLAGEGARWLPRAAGDDAVPPGWKGSGGAGAAAVSAARSSGSASA